MIVDDDDLRAALRDLAEDWSGAEGLRERVDRRIRRRRNRRRAIAAALAVAAVAATVIAVPALQDKTEPTDAVVAGPIEPDDAVDEWRRLSDASIEGRAFAVGVWTGEEIIVWGGTSLDGRMPYADGAAYDPGADTWRRIADSPADGRYTVAAWSGSELLLWGHVKSTVDDASPAGVAYDPARDTWRELPAPPFGSRPYATGVWTGSELLVWGGYDVDDSGHVSGSNDGAAYDPATDSWRALPPGPLEGRYYQGSTWTGTEMVIWGGAVGDGAEGRTFADGASFDPATNVWRSLPAAPISGRSDPALVWTGTEVLVWGGIVDAPGAVTDGALYDPEAGTWRVVTAVPGLSNEVPSPPLSTAWTGGEFVVWGDSTGHRSAGFAFNPRTGFWRVTPDAPVRGRIANVAVWTGQDFIVWGGASSTTAPLADGAAWRPARPPTTQPTNSANEQREFEQRQQAAQAAAARAERQACAAVPDTGVTVDRYLLTTIPYGFLQDGPVETSSTGSVDEGGVSESMVRFVDQSGRVIEFHVVGTSQWADVEAFLHAGAETAPVEIRRCPLAPAGDILPVVWNISETTDRIAATGDEWEYGLTTVVGTGGVSRDELLRLLRGARV